MIYYNEIIFLAHVSLVSIATIVSARLGKEALVSYIALLFVMANIFVIKQIELFSWYATSADAFIIGISFSLNMLQEFWNRKAAQKAVWISFFCSLWYMLCLSCIVLYIPVYEDISQPHFLFLSSYSFRIMCASFASYMIIQYVDMWLYALMKERFQGRYFTIRNYISICISQFLDTILFSFLGLYGLVEHLWHIMLVSYVIKLCAIGMMSPWIMLTKRIVHTPSSSDR